MTISTKQISTFLTAIPHPLLNHYRLYKAIAKTTNLSHFSIVRVTATNPYWGGRSVRMAGELTSKLEKY